ncbi:Signal peptide protein OS=Rhodopirellula maiorica SM1 GN=RMSM_03130 PE=4 SV=1 [Gemmata massiliana]|uniref:Signal peptide protein n=1 Tax=Gemmata massiliana TaxID=1210884 RepID=A0A6P2CUY0_9BACT|nr:hypothetical protein [Gemmata massiliana]VTR92723.1 Signal peptide protein OS=Rhodopirellula maiorica SM1 GN=RMSM_03130 PE=4 SV=1 [Gemmata massiliana]
MPLPQLRVRFVLPFALVAGLTVGVIGCGGAESVQTYTAPKSEGGKAPDAPGAVTEYRILGAMYPADAPAWFFKMPGTADDLAKYEADFDKLLASVSIPANGPPEFTPPEGWKRGAGRGQFVLATLRTPDDKYELTVTSAQGDVFGNVQRWASEQLGNTSFNRDAMPKVTRTVEAKGVKGLRVDVRGPKKPPMGGGGPFMGGMGGK